MQMEDCPKYENCNATICPLWKDLVKTTMITGDKICTYIINFINGEPTPIDNELNITRDIWTAKIGEKRLVARAIGRKNLRAYWENRKKCENDTSKSDMGVKEG